MPGFFNQGLLARASSIGSRIMRKTFNELSEHHSNFSESSASPNEMIRTAYSTADRVKFPLLVKMTLAQEVKYEIAEYHARVAHGLRIGAQREAWKLMIEADPIRGHKEVETLKQRNIALYGSEQPTFDGLVNKYKAKGLNTEAAVKEILQSAARMNKRYDNQLSLSQEKIGVIPLPANGDENRSKLSIS